MPPNSHLAPRESSVQSAIVSTLRQLGAHVTETQVRTGPRTRYRVKKGTLDLLVCYRGRFVALEVKGSDPDGCTCDSCAAQRVEMQRIQHAGGIAAKVRTVEQALDACGVRRAS